MNLFLALVLFLLTAGLVVATTQYTIAHSTIQKLISEKNLLQSDRIFKHWKPWYRQVISNPFFLFPTLVQYSLYGLFISLPEILITRKLGAEGALVGSVVYLYWYYRGNLDQDDLDVLLFKNELLSDSEEELFETLEDILSKLDHIIITLGYRD